MRLVRRCRARVHLLHDHGQPLPEARQRTAHGPQAQPPLGIDIHVEVPAVKYEKLSDDRLGEPSAVVRARVEAAREIQRRRFEGTAMACNADMGPAEIRQFCRVDEGGTESDQGDHTYTPAPRRLRGRCCSAGASVQQLHLSARAYHRVLKLARTIADLAASEQIQTVHIAEAIQYRPRRQV